MWIGHRKEIRKLTFRALVLRRSKEKNLIASFSYSIANSSSIPVVHALQFFLLKSQAIKYCDCVGLIHLTFFYITTSKRFFKYPSTIILFRELANWNQARRKSMIIRTLTNKPTDSKEALYFLLCKVNTTNTSGCMQDTFSPLMVLPSLFCSKNTFSRKTLPFCVSTPILPEISLWFDGLPENHCCHALLSRMCPWN